MGRVATVRLIGGILTAAAVLGTLALRSGGPPPPRGPELESIAARLDDRAARPVAIDPRARAQLRSDALLLRAYETPRDEPIWLFVDYHEEQGLAATVHSPRVCYPGAGWEVDATEEAEVAAGDGSMRPARWLDLRRGESRMVALYWYVSRWGATGDEVRLKLDIVRSAAFRRPSDAALVRLSTPVGAGGREAARARVLAFLAAADAEIARALPFAAPPPAPVAEEAR